MIDVALFSRPSECFFVHMRNIEQWSIKLNNEVVLPSCQISFKKDSLTPSKDHSIKKRLGYLCLHRPGISLVFFDGICDD